MSLSWQSSFILEKAVAILHTEYNPPFLKSPEEYFLRSTEGESGGFQDVKSPGLNFPSMSGGLRRYHSLGHAQSNSCFIEVTPQEFLNFFSNGFCSRSTDLPHPFDIYVTRNLVKVFFSENLALRLDFFLMSFGLESCVLLIEQKLQLPYSS